MTPEYHFKLCCERHKSDFIFVGFLFFERSPLKILLGIALKHASISHVGVRKGRAGWILEMCRSSRCLGNFTHRNNKVVRSCDPCLKIRMSGVLVLLAEGRSLECSVGFRQACRHNRIKLQSSQLCTSCGHLPG